MRSRTFLIVAMVGWLAVTALAAAPATGQMFPLERLSAPQDEQAADKAGGPAAGAAPDTA